MIAYESYVLASSRSAKMLLKFLDEFMPERKHYLKEYPIPEVTECPKIKFDKLEDLLVYLEKNPQESYGLYWDNKALISPFQAMAFFTEDGGLILGLAEIGEQDKNSLQAMAKVTGAFFGTLVINERPIKKVSEFIDFCQRTKKPRLINGNFLI